MTDNNQPVSLDVTVCEDGCAHFEIEEMTTRDYEAHKDIPSGKYILHIDLSKFDEKKFWNFDITFPRGATIELDEGCLAYEDDDIRLYQEFGGKK